MITSNTVVNLLYPPQPKASKHFPAVGVASGVPLDAAVQSAAILSAAVPTAVPKWLLNPTASYCEHLPGAELFWF